MAFQQNQIRKELNSEMNGYIPNQTMRPPTFSTPPPLTRPPLKHISNQQTMNTVRPPHNITPPPLSRPSYGPSNSANQYGTNTNLKQPLINTPNSTPAPQQQGMSPAGLNGGNTPTKQYNNAIRQQNYMSSPPMTNGLPSQPGPDPNLHQRGRYPAQVPSSIPVSQSIPFSLQNQIQHRPGTQVNATNQNVQQMNNPQRSNFPVNSMNTANAPNATAPRNNTPTDQTPNRISGPRMNQPNSRPSNYPQMHNNTGTGGANELMKRLTVEQSPTYGMNLMEQRQIMPSKPILPPKPPMSQDQQNKNSKPRTMRCTFNAVPQTSSLLKQSKLPFGLYIQPFLEDSNIPIISSVITRCRSCRSYLNPFVSIVDHRRWQCNMCYRINDIPEELTYDYSNRQYQDVKKRPELNYGTVEFIAPSEYMLRPPQPSVYVFVLDVSYNAIGTGYLHKTCEIIANNLSNLPGDSRTMVGFVTFNSSVHFYSLKGEQSQPQMFMVSDLEDVFVPVPDGLLVNVKGNKDMILQLLESLPTSFDSKMDTKSATGAAMLAAKKLVSSTGGRITVFQTCLPNVGPGKLSLRESSNMSANSKDVANLNPTTDFYKKLALECAGEQIAVDLFILAGQYSDLGSMSGVSRYSSGCIYYFNDYHHTQNPPMVEKFSHDFTRYLTRAIGFEAVMRLRCTKGMNINTFHGNFFVRSTDLLSLPNVNPDHSFSMLLEIEENLTESSQVGFQAALLYTTTKGERRIRVHTLALPVTSKLSDVYAYADQQAVVASLSKLASDRTLMSSLGDAREALMNACIDCIKSYKNDVINQQHSPILIAPHQLRLLPLYISAMMKNEAFKLGSGVSLDQRVFSLLEFKWQPLADTLLRIYPRIYPLLDLIEEHDEGYTGPPILCASAEKLSRQGVYLMDNGRVFYIFVGRNVPDSVIQQLFNVSNVNEMPEKMNRLPELETDISTKVRTFIDKLRKERTFYSTVEVIREDQKYRMLFLSNLLEDRSESSMSYHEFLQHVQRQVNR